MAMCPTQDVRVIVCDKWYRCSRPRRRQELALPSGELSGRPDTGPAVRGASVSALRSHDRRDYVTRIEPKAVMVSGSRAKPGRVRTAVLRRQPVRIVGDHSKATTPGVYGLIYPSCGDAPDLDDSEVTPRFQRLRGSSPPERGLAAYRGHFGLAWPTRPGLQILLRAR